MNDINLFLYEEIMLLALRDEEGTIAASFVEQVIAGAVLAELLLGGRISVGGSKKQLVDIHDATHAGDPIVDECLDKISASKKPASLQAWVTQLAGLKDLRHRVAQQLCERGILRADQDKVLFLFKRRIYPEINSVPEKAIIERLRAAIFSDTAELDPRTVVLISLADGSDLLNQTFGRKELKGRQERIKQIANGELTGKATKDVITACQTAVMVAAIMPAIVSTTVVS
ncbi:GPP34 family phosphoprotein [Gilvimarinus sp. SDUM040013]|uniref:GPP34 family phosphoprotein n=1 Tax=Gilvimarinus gilvus TaxID=3058038 RepID=A0ABU4RSD8_9GAMM|nr:GPP34 family phosphoprotein [Gilvimarinus sp. SDUM040013]MDO3388245.1 GPP34 family phosphoprotein [Gilvimarinus sp. SDUM040013]MDX6847795.1 GPP34 family phosphoprotein [Gilvimarinus sp. SDUM040013]